jgi:uncharacterized protein (DUF58 family)
MYMQGRWVGQAPDDPGKVIRELFVVLLLIVMIVGAATGSALVVALSGLAFVVTITARLWSALSLEEVRYTLSSDTTHAFIGDEIELVQSIENRKPLPVPWLRITEFLPQGLELVGKEDQFIDYVGGTTMEETASLGRYERMRRRHRVKLLARGHYQVSHSALASGDLFGLYVKNKSVDPHRWNLIVYPDTVPLPDLDLAAARPIGDALSRVPIWRDPTRPAGVREYRPGDPVKTIDWKTTARRNELFVRVFDPSVSQYAVVLTEGNTTDRPWEGFRLDVLESVASCAASVARHALDSGFRTGLIVNSTVSLGGQNVVRPASGPHQLASIMETLAMMRPVTMSSLHNLAMANARDAIPAGASIFFVTGQMRENTVAYVSELAGRGHPVTTLWVGRDDPPVLPVLNVRDYRQVFGRPKPTDESMFGRPDLHNTLETREGIVG